MQVPRCARLVLFIIALAAGAACSKKAPLGGACKSDGDCAESLACHQSECLQDESVKQMRAAQARADQAADGAGRNAGEHVEVESRGAYVPAIIVGAVGRALYRVRFEGKDPSWDEVVPEGRIRGGAKPRRAVGAPAAPAGSDG